MKLKMSVLSVLVALTAVAAVMASAAQAKKPAPAVSVPITSTPTADSTGILQNGQFSISKFRVADGEIAAVGTLTGTVTDLAGNAVGTVSQAVTVPVTQANGSCQILDLTLGPLDLDLLGLVVHLDQVHLNITAEQGPGNLLGNLLCAVAGLLDPPTGGGGGGLNGLLTSIVSLLNQILGAIGG